MIVMGAKNIKRNAVEAVVFGVVQGVGFRPFIYRTARELNYTGWVKNIGFGVEIHLESDKATNFNDFFHALEENKPPLSQIKTVQRQPAEHHGCEDFIIKKTQGGSSFVFISPDISMCENCRREMLSLPDRRYLYPFINCTDCGPRYTIVKDLPYDREKTTMSIFPMCPDCSKEYSDPMDRRYHAQPIACPVCGPQIELKEAKTGEAVPGGVKEAARLINAGKILAVKGLGGFHLICAALNTSAVDNLRKIKTRKNKPLALMARDINEIENIAFVNQEEKQQLLSARRPIVLLRKKKDVPAIAPGLKELGIMLPYTPLHCLLLEEIALIVATSSNLKDSPIMKEEEEGIRHLCDFILTHNRPIKMRADDSVMKITKGQPLFVRRARGYVPYPQAVPKKLEFSGHLLALGGELKDTISVYKNGYVITSQFLGDLDEYHNFKYFEETITHLSSLFEVKPKLVISDLHPDFHTTRFAQRMGISHLQVQHHFAHTLAPMLEHNIPLENKVLGISLDGFGYGADGTAWGGEFLIADYSGFTRFAHLENMPLPGGDLASKQPWRMALSYLIHTYGHHVPEVASLKAVKSNMIKGVQEMIKKKIASPLTSSCGRLFDAVSFLVGLAPLEVSYEAEAPMLLESSAAEGISDFYDYKIISKKLPSQNPGNTGKESGQISTGTKNIISFTNTIRSIIQDLSHKIPVSQISSKFHNTLAHALTETAQKARDIHHIQTVVLTGGVFLNRVLLETASALLEKHGFKVIRSLNYSPNDESISIGQIAFGLNKMREDKEK